MDDWGWYQRSVRIKANGIKAQTQRGQFGKTWWAGKWLAALEQLIDPGRLSRGKSYARSGQVLNLDITLGRVNSRVQGSRPSPYKVQIEIEPLSDADWNRVVEKMAGQALFAAKLLSGEMPHTIEQAFSSAGVSLFPTLRKDLRTDCSCPDPANPCKHIAAVYYLLGEQFDADPFLLFRLRGMRKDELMAMLRAQRSASDSDAKPAEKPKSKTRRAAEPVVPLAKCLDRYWEMGEALEDFETRIQAASVSAIPIKRLGPPGFWADKKVDFIALLADAYEDIGRAAIESAVGRTTPP